MRWKKEVSASKVQSKEKKETVWTRLEEFVWLTGNNLTVFLASSCTRVFFSKFDVFVISDRGECGRPRGLRSLLFYVMLPKRDVNALGFECPLSPAFSAAARCLAFLACVLCTHISARVPRPRRIYIQGQDIRTSKFQRPHTRNSLVIIFPFLRHDTRVSKLNSASKDAFRENNFRDSHFEWIEKRADNASQDA